MVPNLTVYLDYETGFNFFRFAEMLEEQDNGTTQDYNLRDRAIPTIPAQCLEEVIVLSSNSFEGL